MPTVGHRHLDAEHSEFRVYAPGKNSLAVVLQADGSRHPLTAAADGWWTGRLPRLLAGTLYRIAVDGRALPDPASRYQPKGVHGPSMVVEVEPAHSPGWTGVAMADAIIYELHLGTFTAEGTLAAAQARLPYLRDLGINVVELLPIAAFPGERNWGYDGTYLFALHAGYGSWADLKAFIEAAHEQGLAVVLDVVYNHFGPEGNYAGAFAPYTKAAATPWGAAINFDDAWNHGVREFFLENLRFWLEDVGFDGLRMDAVSLIFDNMPVHILREFTDLAREIARRQEREIITIAEHLRNNRHVTADPGFNYHAQWNDDLNHALYAHLTGETARHYANFGRFDDVVKALQSGFVLDGTRLCHHYHYFLGTDGRQTQASEHVVHIQDHDQVGNRPLGDRMIATHGRDKALLGITAVMASPFVPMLFMGEEYGETAPFLFFEDFSDPAIVEGCREGRKADVGGRVVPPDPHARSSFVASKLNWALADSTGGAGVLDYYRQLIALKRSGSLGPRDMAAVRVRGDEASGLITVEAPRTLTLMNFSDQSLECPLPPGWVPQLSSASGATSNRQLPPYTALICRRA
ncbi:Malto-oligosyltrehalose trehalohydrolase [Rubrivivax sp. A210]|uniref:malto-oligosyltrehalose trehalohydrolase n=1 Tax=Rubrivivax sp. A210 TaxID=2772301 RepID=UPI00191B3FF9|nr:malto-oligosyltrehalose trehalohydrolase [Rubrivivax sp. A210]CAD5366256.1 Malto-oligosyltrehalose trehalohydrolase [Rubrivivax sp. A210]